MQDVQLEMINEFTTSFRDRPKHTVYTPLEVVRFIVESAIDKAKDEYDLEYREVTVYDPFCGPGQFPLMALRYLHKKSGAPMRELLRNNIFANDFHAPSVECCKRVLLSQVPDATESDLNVTCGDTFLMAQPGGLS